MGSMSLTIWFWFFLGIITTTSSDHVYDFEESNVPSEITTSTGSLALETNQHKHGTKSLKWQWAAGSELTWDLTSKNIAGEKVKSGGIKLWIKNKNKHPGKCLSFCFSKIKQATGKSRCPPLTNNAPTVSCFPFSLDFKGWRAAWVAYEEFNGCPSPLSHSSHLPSPVYGRRCYSWKITELKVTISAGVSSPSPLYLDIFRFVDNLSQYRATRDATVPPLKDSTNSKTCTSCNKIYSTNKRITEADVLARHSRVSHWHQIYRWSLKSQGSPAATVDQTKFANLNLITRRLINWYSNEDTLYFDKKAQTQNFFVKKRWGKLKSNIKRAGRNNGNINARTPGLFSAISDISGRDNKFSWVSQNVLLPLSLEYFIKSRPNQVDKLACKHAKTQTCPRVTSAVPGQSLTCTGTTQANYDNCKASIISTNSANKRTILEVFDYLRDQGMQAGSGLGSIDFQGLGMSGFMHSAFLMRKELEAANKLKEVIATMKWYNYFGEVYQLNFEFKGSSADVVRTEMLFRLLTVLAMPGKTDDQKKEKIRDMDKLKLWIENALTINEGLGGFIKPDFTTFHHKTFYGSAYSISGLHIASLVYYLLQGTRFQLKDQARTNLVKALEVFRTTAVRYSTPSQIGGRFPRYDQAILAQHVPAYAYLAAKPPNTAINILKDTTLNTDPGIVGMFLRLYAHVGNTCQGKLNGQFCRGNVAGIFYLNTLGSLEIMDKVKTLASGTNAESSPSGHWYKPFVGLSVHRRDNWAVTVKGFNKYVWDYEHGPSENLYGMYASHGSVLIANSESALSSKNVDKGWDWRKIPGTTAINLDYPKMVHTDHRLYNNKRKNQADLWDTMPTMAGGVSLKGSNPNTKSNGVFGMDFIQPTYKPPASRDFRFKKSVFFYDDMIVLLGSNIQCTGCNEDIHTALFQDHVKTTSSSTPAVQNEFRCNDAGSANYRKDSWGSLTLVKLVDVHGNRYYIPNPRQQGLVFTRKKTQTSVKSKGTNVQSTGTYCTAWLNHGKNPTGTKAKYEYLVQVDAEPSGGSRKPVVTPSAIYEVIPHNKAHVVKFPRRNNNNNRGDVYGYVVFPVKSKVSFGSGPLKFVRRQSIIMVEKKAANLFISIAHPDLNLRRVPGSQSWCTDKSGDAPPIKFDDAGKILRFCAKSTALMIPVKLRETWPNLISLQVNGEDKMASKDDYVMKQKALKFTNLKNGYVTEVKYGK